MKPSKKARWSDPAKPGKGAQFDESTWAKGKQAKPKKRSKKP